MATTENLSYTECVSNSRWLWHSLQGFTAYDVPRAQNILSGGTRLRKIHFVTSIFTKESLPKITSKSAYIYRYIYPPTSTSLFLFWATWSMFSHVYLRHELALLKLISVGRNCSVKTSMLSRLGMGDRSKMAYPMPFSRHVGPTCKRKKPMWRWIEAGRGSLVQIKWTLFKNIDFLQSHASPDQAKKGNTHTVPTIHRPISQGSFSYWCHIYN